MTSELLYYCLLTTASVIFSVGMLKFLSRPFFKLCMLSVRQLDLLLDRESPENYTDKLLFLGAFQVLLKLLLFIFLILVLITVSCIPLMNAFPDLVFPKSRLAFELISLSLGFCSLLFLRNKSDYSYWSRLLHHLILDHHHLGKWMLKKSISKAKLNASLHPEEFVIVSGLARAGTTALTRLIYNPDHFHSISYANMPFLMAPRYWQNLYKPKKIKSKERAHKDQLLVNQSSIEALEEYFFRLCLNDLYITEKELMIHDVSEEALKRYLTYQELFRKKEGTRYLAKNNNFLLRYASFKKQDISFKCIVIFRNPLDHARSLWQQHQNFSERQKQDPFELDYMNWLGHHEFGLGHKPFQLNNKIDLSLYNPGELSYWLAVWINYYSYVLSLNLEDTNLILVSYASLLKDPEVLFQQLSQLLKLNDKPKIIRKFERKPTAEQGRIDAKILEQAKAIYKELTQKAI